MSTDSARTHTWGCDEHKEDTFEACHTCDLHHMWGLEARIAELERGFLAAVRWLQVSVANDVRASSLPTGTGYSGEYLNDLADMRNALRLGAK